MKVSFSLSFATRALFLLAVPAVLGLAGIVVSAQQVDLYKDVMAKKDAIVWKNAPDNFIPPPVCSLLQVCGGNPDKFIALPTATENGQRVGRGLILTKDAKGTPTVMMLDQSLDIYFMVVGPDGSLQKVAYHQAGSPSWVLMASSLAQPVFNKDKKLWHDRIEQLGGAPTATPAAH